MALRPETFFRYDEPLSLRNSRVRPFIVTRQSPRGRKGAAGHRRPVVTRCIVALAGDPGKNSSPTEWNSCPSTNTLKSELGIERLAWTPKKNQVPHKNYGGESCENPHYASVDC
jgi:hypothetical protein